MAVNATWIADRPRALIRTTIPLRHGSALPACAADITRSAFLHEYAHHPSIGSFRRMHP
jgi:hypothetical protein